jgi:hypothetical protein
MNTNDIQLTFINESDDHNNSEVVIFQKNVYTDFNEIAVAWKIIKYCGAGWQHSFTFPMTFAVGASDSYGNEIATPITAYNGQMYAVSKDFSGDSLSLVGPLQTRKEVQVRNDLQIGAISANIYKGGTLLATKTGIAPNQKASFQFKPSIWIGVVSQIEEGQIMNSAIISDINTELGLFGVASADIVMTGGGTGQTATPFQFTLSNVQYA